MSTYKKLIENYLIGNELQFDSLIYKFNAQTLSFYSDIYLFINELFHGDYKLKILDLGSRSGVGTEFLAQLYHPKSFSRIKAEVSACDININWVDYSNTFNFSIKEYLINDITKLDVKYDVIILSHTIEHIEDPSKFLDELIARTTKYVIVAAPLEEKSISGQLMQGHINNISYDFIKKYDPVKLKIYQSPVWHQSLCCIFAIKGGSR